MLTTLIALTGLLGAEPVSLSRVYKADDKVSYTMKADFSDNGQDLSADGELVWAVKKLADGGKAEGSLTAVKFGIFTGGNEMQNLDGAKVDDVFNPGGFPVSLAFEQSNLPLIVFLSAAALPGKPTSVGDKYTIDWTGKDGKLSIKGGGKFDSIKEVDGKKRIVLKPNLEITPEGETPADFNLTAEFDAETLTLIRAEGKLNIEGTTANVKIEQKKKG